MWAERILRLRARMGWTQAELAQRMRVSEACVCMWESGERSPNGVHRVMVQILESEREG